MFAPGMAWIIRLPNKIKLPLLACLYTVPLVIALEALRPPVFSWTSFAIAFTYLIAWYLGASHFYSAADSWKFLNTVARRLNERDLRANIEHSADEARARLGAGQFTALFETLVAAHGNLRSLVLQARNSAQAARSAAETLATSNVSLSRRAEDHAATLEETAAAMEQLSSTVKQNAESCRTASQAAGAATVVSRKGSRLANDVILNMEGIHTSSRKIADIIGVIEAIAFQTNILALNAAVEAARAGEQGRGFAVVAEEVRSLAHRSDAAAKQIRTLIAESGANVTAGSGLVDEAGEVMGEVTSNAEKVNELIGVIAVASREQASGVEGINSALAQLQGATQRDAAAVHEAAMAAVQLKEEAARLLELVGRFDLGEEAQAPQAASPRRSIGRPAALLAR
jgi:methyl-accepting chemotaxis protein